MIQDEFSRNINLKAKKTILTQLICTNINCSHGCNFRSSSWRCAVHLSHQLHTIWLRCHTCKQTVRTLHQSNSTTTCFYMQTDSQNTPSVKQYYNLFSHANRQSEHSISQTVLQLVFTNVW